MNINTDFWTCPLCDKASERATAKVVGCEGRFCCQKCGYYVDEVNNTFASGPFGKYRPIPDGRDGVTGNLIGPPPKGAWTEARPIEKVYEWKIIQIGDDGHSDFLNDLAAVNKLLAEGWEPLRMDLLRDGDHEVGLYTLRREKT